MIRKLLQNSGYIALSCFWIAIITGIGLITIFDIASPLSSLTSIQTKNPWGLLIHSLHYWSAQLCLIFSAIHFYEKIRTKSYKNKKVWCIALISILILLLVMISGYIIKGDQHAELAYNIFFNLIKTLPIIGKTAEFLLTTPSGSLMPIYLYHASILSGALLLAIIVHSKKIFSKSHSFFWTCALVTIIALVLPPVIIGDEDAIARAPWYFLSFQEILHWMKYPIIFTLTLIIISAYFWFLPHLKKKIYAKSVFSLLLLLNMVLFLFATFFRSEYWEINLEDSLWKEKYFYPPTIFLDIDKY